MKINNQNKNGKDVSITYGEDNSINVKLFKAKAGLFKKQYHEFVPCLDQLQ